MSQTPNVDRLRDALKQAIEERDVPRPGGITVDSVRRYGELSERIAELQRDLARLEGREYATPLDWSPRWSGGAPLPHVLSAAHRLTLVYLVDEPDPNWEGSYATMKDPANDEAEPLAVVRFDRPSAHRFGDPNQDAAELHRLADSGYHGRYGVYEVCNSSWLRELKRGHGLKEHDEEWRWLSQTRHFLLSFHDETLEVLAHSMELVEVRRGSFREVLAEYAARLVD